MMTEAKKLCLLNRMNHAWRLGDNRPIDVESVDRKTWHVTYENVKTGRIWSSEMYKSELVRQEKNNRVQ